MLSGKFRDKTHARIFRKTAKDKVDVVELESELSAHDTILTYKRKEVRRKTIKAQIKEGASHIERKERTGGVDSLTLIVAVVEDKHISHLHSVPFLMEFKGKTFEVDKAEVVIEGVLTELQLSELKNSGYEEKEGLSDPTFF